MEDETTLHIHLPTLDHQKESSLWWLILTVNLTQRWEESFAVVVGDKDSLGGSPDCLETHYVDQADLELMDQIEPLPLPPSAGIKSVCHHTWLGRES